MGAKEGVPPGVVQCRPHRWRALRRCGLRGGAPRLQLRRHQPSVGQRLNPLLAQGLLAMQAEIKQGAAQVIGRVLGPVDAQAVHAGVALGQLGQQRSTVGLHMRAGQAGVTVNPLRVQQTIRAPALVFVDRA